ncbi:hypothetical protein HU200_061384 [Digitaria exilis]|uniref:Uncharacterized protein n=1 Tax=Digitaria exilis TaxID=1010633 RepID=A0A835A940_9POAL|nr:hypothetical protein HU200_061384 [Digitaria exilis]
MVKAYDSGKNMPETDHRCSQCGRPHRLRKHLYVVVDDWSAGFSVHKLDIQDEIDKDEKAKLGTLRKPKIQRLPPSPVRIAFSGIGAGARIAAMGRKIIACTEGEHGLTVVYDTDTAGLAMVRYSPDALHYHWEQAMAAGDALYAIVSKPTGTPSDGSGSADSGLHCSQGEMFSFEEVTEYPEEAFCLDDVYDDNRVGKKCTWRTDPLEVPFYLCHGAIIRSYAMHPGGNRFYVSVTPAEHRGSNARYYGDDIPDLTEAEENAAKAKAGGTFTYHTKTREWTHLGTWMLPFAGQGYYDPELDAWVGFDMPYHGKIGCCDIPSRPWGSPEPPIWKLCNKDISLVKSSVLDNTNVLVRMGSGRFCLVQSMPRDGVDDYWGDGDKFELHVTTFRARYGKKGELTITDSRLVSSYVLSRYATYENFTIQAFWM